MLKTIILKLKKLQPIYWLMAFFIFLYSAWSIKRHLHFQTDAVDLGIFDQVIYQYSQFQAPLSTVKFGTFPGFNILGDHFHPILALLAPLYWIWKDPSTILVVQAFAVGLAAWPLYQLAMMKFQKVYLALSIAFCYLAFIGVQTLIDYDFHEIALALPLLSFAFLFLHQRRFRLYFLFIIVALFVKEDVPLYVAMLGFYSLIRLRSWKVGLATIGLGLASYFIITSQIIPYFKKDGYAYEHLPAEIGKTGLDLVVKSLTNPFLVAKAAFYDGELLKIRTSFNLLGSFGFLPLLSPETLVLALPNVAERFLTTLIQRWIIRFQYSAILGPIFALATIHALENLFWVLKKTKIKRVDRFVLPFVSVVLVVSSLYFTFRNNGPLMRMLNPTSYRLEENLRKNYEVLKLIPSGASVGAQSSLVPHLSRRREIYSLEPSLLTRVQPDYIVLTNLKTTDTFYGYEYLEAMKADIKKRPDYEIIVDDGTRFLVKKKETK